MKLEILIIGLIIITIFSNIVNYNTFLLILSITWYITSILIIYSAIKYSIKYKFIQLNFRKIYNAIKSKSNNDISPLSSLSISLAAKIGVGSLSGIALCIYFGGIGTMFWLVIISLIVCINTYVECLYGVKYRTKIGNSYVGGPGYYIIKCLNNKKMGYLYGILIIITYSGLFLCIQTNTIISVTNMLDINNTYVIVIMFITIFLITIMGTKGISMVNSKLVPLMLLFYIALGGYIVFVNRNIIGWLFINTIKEAFNIKSIIPVFLMGMQRAIFITESSIGTSAISAAACDNDPQKQGLLEVMGIYIVTFVVCMTTFIIVVTSDYYKINFMNVNGIEIIMYAFNYHFGNIGRYFLAIITILFAFSTIISSYFFGENNLKLFSVNKKIKLIYEILFLIIIIVSCYLKPNFLWDMTDYFIAILAIINVSSIIRINK